MSKDTEWLNKISEAVSKAVESGDFGNLSNTAMNLTDFLRDSVKDFTNPGDNKPKSSSVYYKRSDSTFQMHVSTEADGNTVPGNNPESKAQYYHRKQEEEIQRNKSIRIEKYVSRPTPSLTKSRFKEVGAFSAPVYIIIGAFIGFVFAVSTLGFIIDMMIPATIVSALFTGIGAFLVWKGLDSKKLLTLARKYRSICSSACYASVDNIAQATGTDNTKVVKNIKKMLEKGFFPEGYLDAEETTLMLSRQVYDEYKKSLIGKELQIEEKKKEEEKYSNLTTEQINELQSIVDEGKKASRKLRQLNDEIEGEEISAKLDMLETLNNEIFDRLEEHPEQIGNCHKLMDYYIPTMLKLVQAYREYDKVSNPGQDVISAKEEIEKTIDTINEAFAELQNRMFRDSVWDVKADARVLSTMLKQDGLT